MSTTTTTIELAGHVIATLRAHEAELRGRGAAVECGASGGTRSGRGSGRKVLTSELLGAKPSGLRN